MKHLRILAFAATAMLASSSRASAHEAFTTGDVNMRAGPGSRYPVVNEDEPAIRRDRRLERDQRRGQSCGPDDPNCGERGTDQPDQMDQPSPGMRAFHSAAGSHRRRFLT